MSLDDSTKKPLAEDGGAIRDSAGAVAPPATADAGTGQARQTASPGGALSMDIETPPGSPAVSCSVGSFGGPSENFHAQGGLVGYIRALRHEPDMDKLTDLAVTLSTFPFLFIQIPQIYSNFVAPHEIPAAWTGIVSGGMGNLLLCTFFADGGEWAQARVQAIGAITNIFVVAQARLLPKQPIVPLVPFLVVMLVMIAGLVIPLLKAMGRADNAFDLWLKGTTIIGATVLCFSLTYSIMDDGAALLGGSAGEVDELVPSVISLVGLVVSSLCVHFGVTTSSTGGILATVLFMYMPVPQLIKNLVDESAAQGFNLGFVYFGLLGNGLGMPRALYTRNYVWLSGSSWGCFVGGVLMSVTLLIANSRSDVSFITGASAILLTLFNVCFLVYSAAVFYCTLAWDLRPKPPSQREFRVP